MTKTIKCENCGANMDIDIHNMIRFCPFCGNAVKMPENYIDLEKFSMQHRESVRQQIIKEKREDAKQDNKKTIVGIICVILAIIAVGYLLMLVDPDMKCERIVNKVQQLIIEENYDEAIIEAQKIRVDKQGLFDSRYDHWENQRKDLVNLIEQKKKESKK